MFELCCGNPNVVKYDIVHNPKPVSWVSTEIQELEKLLWYVPNIDSFQSSQIDLLDDKLYEDFIFSFVMSQMGIDEEKDVKWLTYSDVVLNSDVEFFQNEICDNCQKIIICAYTNQTKIKNLLRTVRNSIAHGHFALQNNILIGFNKNGVDGAGNPKYKGIVKISPSKLLLALNRLESPMAKESLVGYAFMKAGYQVEHSIGSIRYDLRINKNNHTYYVEVKSIKGQRYFHPEHIRKEIEMLKSHYDGIPLILMIDTSKITNEVKKAFSSEEGVYIFDISKVKELLEGNDILEYLNE